MKRCIKFRLNEPTADISSFDNMQFKYKNANLSEGGAPFTHYLSKSDLKLANKINFASSNRIFRHSM